MNDNLNGEWKVIGETLTKNGPAPKKDTTKIVGIYGLKNKVNGKWYIGKSTDIHDRWKDYHRLHCKEQPKIYNALLKYGYEAFEKIVIEICDPSLSKEILDQKEIDWIKFHKSYTHGYNLTEGGDGFSHTSETKQKIREALVGKTHSNETRLKMSISQKNRAKTEASFGKRKCLLGIDEKKRRYLEWISPVIAEIQLTGNISWNQMATQLNNRGILSPRGKRWNKSSVKYLIKSALALQ